jgi:3-ketosteroid 9alpha-monooxygenase subunit A
VLVPFTWKVTGWFWRYQKYVEHPPLFKVDAKGYMALRKWATQFYEVPA